MATPSKNAPNGALGEIPVPVNQQGSPFLMNVANYLRNNNALKMRTGLLNNKEEIDFFRFKRLQRTLLSDDYKNRSKNGKNQLIPIPNEQDAAKVFVSLIQARLILPVDKLHYDEIKQVKGWKPNRSKPTLRPSNKAAMGPDAYYAWVYTKPNPFIMLYGFLIIAAVFAIVLFPLWPRFMRVGVWYLSMGCLGLLGLFFAMAIVRLIIFIITFLALPQAFWLYPNLFEDCGFFESFQPLYAWSEPSGKKSKKKRSKPTGTEPKIEELKDDVPNESVASGVEQASGSTKKRPVTLEEVED